MSAVKDDSEFKAGEFKGRVESDLKYIRDNIITIKKGVNELKEEAKENQKEVRKEMKIMAEKINNNRFKIAGIGATVSLVVTILVLLANELLRNGGT